MLEFGKGLDVGVKRKGKKNQDALKVVKPWFRPPLLIVADGMGGFIGGSEASQIVIKTLEKAYRRSKMNVSIENLLSNAILEAHQRIIKRSQSSDSLAKMGTTVVCAVVDEKRKTVTIANVGDTRAYLISQKSIQQISFDHSEVAELARKGVLSEIEARDYYRKNVLTMSLAANRPSETIKPFVNRIDYPADSLVLLCSDGLWGCVSEHLIQLTALEYQPKKAVKKLVEFANTSGGPDNISVLIARRKGEWKTYQKQFSNSLEDTL